ncbi:hypothetical protein CCACVL1_17870 [Corchorus capsularis]|uniref:Uncharacterized protein n=1 Tax=Corchorus capsularis TaxID=210143 RepID=A0A1R3HPG8_COCAP|nr:hypothetical protein CCACVL1_17870 [Corchorus capsularis]
MALERSPNKNLNPPHDKTHQHWADDSAHYGHRLTPALTQCTGIIPILENPVSPYTASP